MRLPHRATLGWIHSTEKVLSWKNKETKRGVKQSKRSILREEKAQRRKETMKKRPGKIQNHVAKCLPRAPCNAIS